MSTEDFSTFMFSEENEDPRFLDDSAKKTYTIDIRNLFTPDMTNSGSFDLRGVETTFVGRLLHSLPNPALLVDPDFTIIFANKACAKAGAADSKVRGKSLPSFFPKAEHAEELMSLLRKVFLNRKPQLTAAMIDFGEKTLWGRIHLTSLRLWQERSVLVLIEDLTLEKKQLLLQKRHKDDLRKAHDQLERRVEERTGELRIINHRLEREIMERRRAEQELDTSRAGFTSIVEKSHDGIVIVDADGMVCYANPAARRLIGASGRPLVEKYFGIPLIRTETAEISVLTPEGKSGMAEMHVARSEWQGCPAYLAVIRDITQRKRAEEALRESEQRYRQMFERNRAIKLLINPEAGSIVDANPAAAEFYGHTIDRLKSMHIRDIASTSENELFQIIREAMSEKQNYFVIPNKLASGEIRNVEIRTGPIELREGKLLNVIIHDVTDRSRVEAELHLAAKIIESTNEAIIILDTNGIIVSVNQAFCRITGYRKREIIGKTPSVFEWGKDEILGEIINALNSTGQWQGEVWDKRKSGEIYPKLLSLSAIRNNGEAVSHYVGIFSDITKLKKAEKHLYRLAHFDTLTKLPNRLLFKDRLQRALIQADRRKTMVALMLLDLDRFKNINDTLGHGAGDQLLVSVAERLSRCVRKSDTVARLGGDEFTVVLPDIQNTMAATGVARKILKAMSKPFELAGRGVFITTSVGITIYPADGVQADRLLQNADMALYHAKEQGKNNFQFFSEEMNTQALKRSLLEDSLRTALERDEFEVYYQPRLDLRTGEILDLEALLRWNHPQQGLITPGNFIGVAEETGLIIPIGDWVLKTACEQNKRWHEMGFNTLGVAVNVSARQFNRQDFIQAIFDILDETRMDPSWLELELTESVAMKDAASTAKLFNDLKMKGVRISIDDFGTGYSSLSYLKSFPIDKLKIDQSFVKDLATESDDESIVKAVIAVAHSLKLKVVAEGVETKEQLKFLRLHHCDEWQGYYFSRPVPTDEVTELLRINSESLDVTEAISGRIRAINSQGGQYSSIDNTQLT